MHAHPSQAATSRRWVRTERKTTAAAAAAAAAATMHLPFLEPFFDATASATKNDPFGKTGSGST
jgi:hypothetical protein